VRVTSERYGVTRREDEMVVAPLLTTKLHIPPLRPNLVSRPRLIQRLDEGLDLARKLTLVSAAAGTGKTTLLSEWVSRLQAQVAWLSLEEEDNDQARFWTYLSAAFEKVGAGLGQELWEILQGPQPAPLAPVLTPLLNELATRSELMVLILDDYHLISNQAIHDGLSFLLEHQPSQFHLVLATRADPPLPIAQLRARGDLTELRIDDLRFTFDETTAFLNDRMELGLPAQDVSALESRTEGWIVGLHLAALALQGSRASRGRTEARAFIDSFTGSHHYILEYLTEEVLSQQPEPVQRFLLRTSILDRLCGSLCDALGVDTSGATVAVQSDGGTMLAHLHQANLFLLPLDDRHEWYRYHPLFADLLLKRLRLQMAPEQVSELYRSASAWHEEGGSLDEAVKYALQAQDFERVVRLAEQAASAGLLESRLTTMLRWLEGVPEELLLLRPRLRIFLAWALVVNEQLDRAEQMLRESSAALQSMAPSPESDALRNELAMLLAIVNQMASSLASAYGGEDLEKVFQTALEVREGALAAGNLFLAGHATNGLAMTRFYQGRLSQAAEHYRQLVDLGMQDETSRRPLATVGHVGLAGICVERNELEAARLHLDEGMRLGQHRVGANTLVSAAVTRSRLRYYAGDAEGAFKALAEVEQIPHVRDSAPSMHRLIRQRAWLELVRGDLDQAAHLVRRLGDLLSHGRFGGTIPASLHEAQQILQARVHLAQGRPAEALAVLDALYAPAEAAGRFGRILEIALLRALAFQAQRNPSAALAALARSLELAEPEGYLRVYVDGGSPAAELLRDLGKRAGVPAHLQDYAQGVLASFDPVLRETGEPGIQIPTPDLVEPLTPRERQVLRLMAAGLSGPEIAEELVVATSTVRSHIKSIYGKLDVHSRYEAIERARALELV
jgi:LuxR family maltose regulon positive regulatory protein